MRFIAATVVVTAVGVTASARPAEPTATRPARVTGVFSDMHYIAEAADVVGFEVIIAPSHDGSTSSGCGWHDPRRGCSPLEITMAVKGSRSAYSTGPGGALPAGYQACKRCGNWPCRCEPQSSAPPAKQAVRVRRETAGRGGKTVTTVAPLLLSREDAQALLAEFKKLCGSGGALKADKGSDGKAFFCVEVQGDHADKVLAALVAKGYPAKRAGG